ncbi:membrane hypothetical protein [Vibrio nigripulchritudo MADA3029]|uniref:hypothetical protein n=1 Tax=Vibrio nigripulchritudo TaxID=28173 RepID=UPI0003B222DB|nr:hypothetical protein [Vibrio nigripulchritudo]CCN46020.1 membrane hypothetical protein [Vibrio nigripulchritudo MADA3020]CCN54144.1 membrane hypothetical protein [Vibrio nigripulchritudo MADA3021]CCN61214.1 membrane hypothetical protein [Vibrio nigripulchritudo MADA3029]
MKKLFILLSAFMSIPAIAYTVDNSVEEKISDCKVNFENEVVVQSFRKVRDCLVEKRVDSKSFHVYQENRLEDANADLFESHTEFFKTIFLYSFIIGAFSMLFKQGLTERIKNDPAEAVMLMLATVTTTTLVLSSSAFAVRWIFDNFIITNQTILVSQNKILSDNIIEKKKSIEANSDEVSSLSKTFSESVMSSEVCAFSYVNKHITASYDYDFVDADIYEQDEFLKCIKEEKTNAGVFNMYGRSPLNYAVKVCSVKHHNVDHDCGSVVFNNTPIEVVSTLNITAPNIITASESMKKVYCKSVAQKELSHQKSEYLCRNWNGSEFEILNTDIAEQELDTLIVKQVSLQTHELIDALARSIDNEENLSEQPLFGMSKNLYNLFFTDSHDGEVIEKVSGYLNTIDYSEGGSTLLNNGWNVHFYNNLNDHQGVDSQDDLALLLINKIENLHDSDSIDSESSKSFLNVLYDPKLIVGSYVKPKFGDTCIGEKGCFEFDLLAFKKMVQHHPEILKILISVKTSSSYAMAIGSDTTKSIAVKANKMSDMLLISFCVVAFYLMIRFVIGFAINHYIRISTKSFIFTTSMQYFLITKTDTSKVITNFIDLILDMFLPIVVLFLTVILSNVFLTVAHDYQVDIVIAEYYSNEVVDVGSSMAWLIVFLISFIVVIEMIYRIVDSYRQQKLQMNHYQEDSTAINHNQIKSNLNELRY